MSETDLCAEIRAWAEQKGFVVYPEVLGWDLVLVPRGAEKVSIGRFDVAPGEQVGVHAKLRANCDVIAQALPPAWKYNAHYPTWAVVAVPVAGRSFRFLAERFGLGVVVTERNGRKTSPRLAAPQLVETPRRSDCKPLTLPTIASRAIVAGAPSPRVLSVWREKALRFLIWARANDGRIRIADLQRFGISRSWSRLWFADTGQRSDRCWSYRLVTDPARLPDHGYEDVYAELLAAVGAAS